MPFCSITDSVYFDNVPPNTVSVDEDTIAITNVKSIKVVGTTPTLEITSQTPSSPVFTLVVGVSPVEYELQTPAGLDYESVSSFTVNIR